MKTTLALLAAVFFLSATASHAAVVDVTDTIVSPGSYEVDGTLAADATAAFELTVAGANPSSATYAGYIASLSPTTATGTTSNLAFS